jgi:hypothetical protein
MVRVKYSSLAKLFGIFFTALFVIPSILRFLGGPSNLEDGLDSPPGNGGGGGFKQPREPNEKIDNHKGPSDDLSQLRPELEAVFKEETIGNYEPTNLEERTGVGEGGVPVQADPSEKSKADQTVREFGFNMVVSDKISLDRRIKDTRPDEYFDYYFRFALVVVSITSSAFFFS